MTDGSGVPAVVAVTPAATPCAWWAGRFRRRTQAGWKRAEQLQRE
ncbi:hypothetical protein [Streptomyces sp. NRRL F-5755]